MFDYDKYAAEAVIILDKYDLKENIAACKKWNILEPYDIREYIGNCNNSEVVNALENLSNDELMEYLTEKYGVRWEEIISYRMHLY